ncbi:SAM-dependent RNA methyltransferase [Boletus edulis BED1]|uniref:SAM-dependent RNA methyltransferase n=1 Tax=Boletus edulis BED1 TaxID=1328754 RepID=A0AAD4C9L9_BOLED|nr:SAM-dependent RNA methyltransferase [Boletus edulis BED1]
MGLTYVIEHMEEDEATPSSLPPWVELEYTHMKMLAGASARVLFTNLSQRSCASLREKLASLSGPVASHGVYTQSILEMLKNQEISLSQVCLLDPKAERKLEPEDGLEFEWFIFGGILGDDPPRDRTSQLRQLGFPTRHLGPVQMTTDTALGVTKRVIHDKVSLEEIPYVTFPTIKFNARESVEMPFKYIADRPGGEPLLPPGMKELLYEDLNKGFDF